jgi:hypothetical protein
MMSYCHVYLMILVIEDGWIDSGTEMGYVEAKERRWRKW